MMNGVTGMVLQSFYGFRTQFFKLEISPPSFHERTKSNEPRMMNVQLMTSSSVSSIRLTCELSGRNLPKANYGPLERVVRRSGLLAPH
jgi:hypothetical protein